MICNFKFICPQMWWMVDVCFSHVLDEGNLTQTQEKCLDLDIQDTNILFRSLHDSILGEIMNRTTAHEIWSYLNEKYVQPPMIMMIIRPMRKCMRMMIISTTWWL